MNIFRKNTYLIVTLIVALLDELLITYKKKHNYKVKLSHILSGYQLVITTILRKCKSKSNEIEIN